MSNLEELTKKMSQHTLKLELTEQGTKSNHSENHRPDQPN